MNEVILPPAPNWYSDSVLLCTPDKYVIYASRKDIVIIKPAPPTEAAEVKIISNAHSDRVLAISANSVAWGLPHKLIVSIGDDKMVQLWDFETFTSQMSHKAHEANNSQIVSATFAGERIISVAENGQIIVWRTSTNTTQTLSNIFGFRVKVMSMATCPHASYITAFGMATGLVVVADLRRTGKVLYRMREHDHDITGLSWCPTPYNIYKTKTGLQMMDSLKKKLSRPTRNMEIKDDKVIVTLSDPSTEIIDLNKPMDSKSEISLADSTSNESTNATDENKMNDFEKMFAQKCQELQTDLAQKEVAKTEEKEATKPGEKEQVVINQESIIIDDSPKKALDSPDFKQGELKYPVRSRPVVDKKNPWGNVVFNDSDEEDEEPKVEEAPKVVPASDFLSECLNLRKKIIDYSQDEDLENSKDESNAKETSKDILKEEFYSNDENEDENEKQEEEIQVPSDSIDDYEILGKIDDSEVNKSEASLVESMQSLAVSSTEQNKTENSSNDQLSVTEIIEKCNDDPELKHSNKQKNTNKADTYELDLTLSDPESSKDYLLASVCRAGTICIWRAGSDGRLEIQLPKHMKSASSHKKRDVKNWITLCWAQPTLILSSSIWNELLLWDLIPKPNKSLKFQIKSSLVHADHKKFIFQIATPFKLFETPDLETWRDDKELSVWTTSQDRWMLKTNLSNRCNTACYCTFGGLVNCISVSQLDPNKIALAVGDGTIRVWDLSRPHLQTIMMMAFFDRVHTKASFVDWHPVKEKCLAFSTSEGRIGEYDLNNKSRSATIYSNYHRSSVYKIQWGPLPDNEASYGVYSCSLGEFIVHDPAKHYKQPYEIKVFEDENVTTFAWKADYSVLAVGTKTGTVKLLTKQFKVIQTLYMQKKSVRGLEWHPLATAYDSGISEFANYLAVSTMENDIYVYDCITEENTESSDKKVIVLQGHENGVRNISWCPHIGGRLVSSCEDGISIVWDVKTQTILSTYNSSPDCGPSVVWSPLDADLIILGGKTLKIWRITKHPPVPIVSKKIENKQKKRIVVESQPIAAKTEKVEKERRKHLLNTLTKHLHDHEFVLKNCKKLIHQLDNKVEKKTEDNEDSDLSDAEEFEDAKENHDLDAQVVVDPLKLFGGRKDVISILDYEQSLYLQQKKTTPHGHLGLWKGTMAESIKHAIEMNQITPWIINMAPMVSHKLWLELCEKYANNLRENGEHMEASSYYLTCHKVDEAIESLCQGNYHKEALILANVRLPEGNNTVPAIIEKWCKYSAQTGCYEVAAQCYIKMGKFSEAAEILNKRSDQKTLEFAAELAQRAVNKDLLSAINLKLDAFKRNESSEVKLEGIAIYNSRLEAMIKKGANLEITDETVGNHETVD